MTGLMRDRTYIKGGMYTRTGLRDHDVVDIQLPQGACALCGEPVEGEGLCAECHGDLYVPPVPHKRQRKPRTPEQNARETARRAELRRDPAYRSHQELLRRQRLRRNKRQLATVTSDEANK